MEAMKEFTLWFLTKLPDFLMSEPICYIIGFVFAGLAIVMFRRIIK